MQYSFQQNCKRIGINSTVYGFFIGQLPAIKEYLDKGMINKSYLFDYTDIRAAEAYKSGTQLLEAVYFANHGTTIGYDGEGKPVLADTGINKYVTKRLLEIQDGIVQFAQDFGYTQKKYHFIKSKVVKDKTVDFYAVQLVKNVSKCSIRSFKDGLSGSAWKNAFIRKNIHLPSTYWLYQCIRHTAKKFL